HRIVRIDLAKRSLVDISGTRGEAGHRDGEKPLFDHPEGLALDGAGHAYVAEWSASSIREVALATGATRTIAGGGAAGHVDGTGDLYATMGQGLFRLRDGRAELVAGDRSDMGHGDGIGARARFRGPVALAAAPDGSLVVAEVNGQVRRVDPRSGAVVQLRGLD